MLAAAVASGGPTTQAAGLVVVATLAAVVPFLFVGWPRVLAALILIILFIPIRRYSLPGNLPFELEPYRVFVAALLLGWFASLLTDPRSRLRRTGFEGPLSLIVVSALGSIATNPDRVAQFSSIVDKKLMFFLSFVLVLYVTASSIRRLGDIDYLAKTLVVGGAIVGGFAMIEARTGFNVFNHLDRAFPILRAGAEGEPEAFQKYGAAKLRVFGSAQHPIALSAAFVVLVPLAVYLAHRYRQRRWLVCAVLLIAGCSATVSRTGVVMLVVVALVFIWLRPREVRRYWPALIPALIVIKLVLPGTLGAIKQSFLPAGGLIAEQKSQPGESGSGRLADLGPALQEWRAKPLLGQGFGTRVVDPNVRGPEGEHPRQPMARHPARDRDRRLLRLALVLRACRETLRQGGEEGRLGPRLAARFARGGRLRLRRRHVHLRRVRVHPGHVPALHLRRARIRPARRAAHTARRRRAGVPAMS